MWIKVRGGSLYNLNNFSRVYVDLSDFHGSMGKYVLVLESESETYVAGTFDKMKQAEKVKDEIFKHLHLGSNTFDVPGGDTN